MGADLKGHESVMDVVLRGRGLATGARPSAVANAVVNRKQENLADVVRNPRHVAAAVMEVTAVVHSRDLVVVLRAARLGRVAATTTTVTVVAPVDLRGCVVATMMIAVAPVPDVDVRTWMANVVLAPKASLALRLVAVTVRIANTVNVVDTDLMARVAVANAAVRIAMAIVVVGDVDFQDQLDTTHR
ncbi:MAG: hypothetical protein ACPGVU_22935 [Limisphaerales bacterium]